MEEDINHTKKFSLLKLWKELSVIFGAFALGFAIKGYCFDVKYDSEKLNLQSENNNLKDSIKNILNNTSYDIQFDTSLYASLNTDSKDFKLIRGMNSSKEPFRSTKWRDFNTAKIGDRISVALYFHNTGNVVASQVQFNISTDIHQNIIVFNAIGHCFNCSNIAYGSTVFEIDDMDFELVYDTVNFNRYQSLKPALLPFNQTGYEIFESNGLLIDSIPSGDWIYQGNLVYYFILIPKARL